MDLHNERRGVFCCCCCCCYGQVGVPTNVGTSMLCSFCIVLVFSMFALVNARGDNLGGVLCVLALFFRGSIIRGQAVRGGGVCRRLHLIVYFFVCCGCGYG